MALVNPYCTVAQLQKELGNTDISTADSEEAINFASRWIDDYKGRDYFDHDHSSTAITITEFEDMVFGEAVFLPYRPIRTLTEVKVGTTTLVEDTDFVKIADDGKLIRIASSGTHRSTTPWGIVSPDEKMTVKGTFGYAQGGDTTAVPTSLPTEITIAAVLVAAALSGQNRKEVAGFDGTLQSVNDRDIPKEVFRLLGRRHKILI